MKKNHTKMMSKIDKTSNPKKISMTKNFIRKDVVEK